MKKVIVVLFGFLLLFEACEKQEKVTPNQLISQAKNDLSNSIREDDEVSQPMPLSHATINSNDSIFFGDTILSIVSLKITDIRLIKFIQSNDFLNYSKKFGFLDVTKAKLISYRSRSIKTIYFESKSTGFFKRIVMAYFVDTPNPSLAKNIKFFTIVQENTSTVQFATLEQDTSIAYTMRINYFTTNRIFIEGFVVLNNKLINIVDPPCIDCLPAAARPFRQCVVDSFKDMYENAWSAVICTLFAPECVAAVILHCTFESLGIG